MNRRKNITGIMDEVELGKEEILEKIQVATIKWNEMKKKGKEFREKDLLDYHDFEVVNNTPTEKRL